MQKIVFLALFVLAAGTVQAQINKLDFSDVTDMSLLGSATQAGNELRITDTVANQTGNAWHLDQQGIIAGFDVTFDFRITPGPVLAEGFAFIIQNGSQGTATTGGTIWRLGYANIPNSLAVEFDTFQDGFINDTSANELSVHTRGMLGNDEDENFSLGRVTPAFNVSDGMVHTMRINYVPGTLEVFIDNLTTPLLSIAYDFLTGGSYLTGGSVGGLNLPDGTAWVGFSGTTGANNLNERVEILNWTMNSTPGVPASFDGNVGANLGEVEDVLSANNSTGGFSRRVETETFLPLSFQLAQPSANPSTSNFLVFGQLGASDGLTPFNTVYGDLCIPPHIFVNTPDTFTLANTFNFSPVGLLPASGTPWNVIIPGGLTTPAVFTIQAAVEDDSAPLGISVTNGVIVDVGAAAAPTIQSLFPSSAAVGDPITISGAGFNPNAVLTIDGTTVLPLSVTADEIVFSFPGGGLGCDVALAVTNPDGQSATSNFNPTPVINNGISPQGPSAGGQSFIMIGSGFAPGTTVTFGTTPAALGTVSASVVVAIVPAGTPGPVTVTVTTPGGCSTTTTYTYL